MERTTHTEGSGATAQSRPAARSPSASGAAFTILRLQSGAGNAAVAGALQDATRGASLGPLAAQLGRARAAFGAHPSGSHAARAAQAAARPPPDERIAQGHEQQAGQMAATQPDPFDKTAFVEAVITHLSSAAPKTGDEADAMASGAGAAKLPPGIVAELTRSADAAARPLAGAANATPDTSGAQEKAVQELPPAAAPPRAGIDPELAVPPRVPPARTDFSDGPRRVEAQMVAYDLTEDQLADANEPSFTAALAAKQAVIAHAASAPAEVRRDEAAHRGEVRGIAQTATGAALGALAGHASRSAAAKGARQQNARQRDEAARAGVSAHVNEVFGRTQAEVRTILTNLESTVPTMFDSLQTIAHLNFGFEYRGRLQAYKDERHSGWFGWVDAIGDAVTGLPDEVEKIYTTAKKNYLDAMRTAVSNIADFVGRELRRAKQRVADGRSEIATYVAGLSPKLRAVGVEAAADIDADFDTLDASVDDTVTDLAATLGEKYAQGVAEVDADLAASRKDEQGLLADAKDFLSDVWDAVGRMKKLLFDILSSFVSSVTAIIRHPIKFFRRFVKSVAAGVGAFVTNLGTELLTGVKTWLFGKLPGGITMPDSFDARGIVRLILDIMGLSWDQLQQNVLTALEKALHGAVPEAVRERVIAWVQAFATGGPAALVEMVIQRAGDLVDSIKQKALDYLESTVIHAAMDKVVMLLGGPAGGFIETCKLIYHAFRWLVDNAERIGSLVLAFLRNVNEIAEADGEDVVPGVPDKVRTRLTDAIPLLIDGLASLLGLGDIGPHIRGILDTVRRPVTSVVDKIVRGAVKVGRGLMRGLAGSRLGRAGAALKAKAGAAVASGKAWAGATARRVAEFVGLVDKGFAVGAESHTVSVDTRDGAVYLASRRGPIARKIRQYVENANARRRIRNEERRKKGLPQVDKIMDVDPQVALVDDQVKALTKRVQQAKQGKDAVAREQLDELARLVSNLLISLHGGGTDQAGDPDRHGLGTIARHGDQDKYKTGPLVHRLESEHVLPVRIVSLLLEALDLAGIDRQSPEDDYQHTIMIYESAAHRKTRGTESTDHNLINQLKAIAATGVPALYGKGQVARRLRKDRTRAQYAEVVAGFEKKSSQIAAMLHEKLPAIMSARAEETWRAVVGDHQPRRAKLRDLKEPTPNEARIRTAAALQAKDIVDIVIARLPKPRRR